MKDKVIFKKTTDEAYDGMPKSIWYESDELAHLDPEVIKKAWNACKPTCESKTTGKIGGRYIFRIDPYTK